MNVAILSGPSLGPFDLRCLDPFFENGKVRITCACVDGRKPMSKPARAMRELRRRRSPYVLVMAAASLMRRGSDRSEDAIEYFQRRGIPTLVTENLYSDKTLAFLSGGRPDCLYRMGFGIIREPVLSLAPRGVVSYHHGNLRHYRGIPPAFWELYNNEPDMSVTVQVLSPALDAGRIVRELRVPIRQGESWSSLYDRIYDLSGRLAYEACECLADPSFEPEQIPPEKLGRLCTLPTLRQWLTLQFRVVSRRISGILSPSRNRQGVIKRG
jgi:folate-dependent phosphoribosylglycinamide formyltransferase PurN